MPASYEEGLRRSRERELRGILYRRHFLDTNTGTSDDSGGGGGGGGWSVPLGVTQQGDLGLVGMPLAEAEGHAVVRSSGNCSKQERPGSSRGAGGEREAKAPRRQRMPTEVRKLNANPTLTLTPILLKGPETPEHEL